MATGNPIPTDRQLADSRSAPVSLAGCITRPDLLRLRLSEPADRPLSAQMLRIRASVLHQDLALTVVAPLVCDFLFEGDTDSLAPENIWLVDHRGSGPAWYRENTGVRMSPDQFIKQASAEVTRWYPMFRQILGVSPGAYWSSIGLAFSAPFSALYDSTPPEHLCQAATDWLALFDCDARRFIDWIPAEFDRHPCAIPQRRGCCLKYRLPGGVRCGTCGLYRKERMATLKPLRSGSTRPEHWSPAQ